MIILGKCNFSESIDLAKNLYTSRATKNMAQGNLKKKVKLPVGAKQKKQHIKKQSGVKKGRTYFLMVCVGV